MSSQRVDCPVGVSISTLAGKSTQPGQLREKINEETVYKVCAELREAGAGNSGEPLSLLDLRNQEEEAVPRTQEESHGPRTGPQYRTLKKMAETPSVMGPEGARANLLGLALLFLPCPATTYIGQTQLDTREPSP